MILWEDVVACSDGAEAGEAPNVLSQIKTIFPPGPMELALACVSASQRDISTDVYLAKKFGAFKESWPYYYEKMSEWIHLQVALKLKEMHPRVLKIRKYTIVASPLSKTSAVLKQPARVYDNAIGRQSVGPGIPMVLTFSGFANLLSSLESGYVGTSVDAILNFIEISRCFYSFEIDRQDKLMTTLSACLGVTISTEHGSCEVPQLGRTNRQGGHPTMDGVCYVDQYVNVDQNNYRVPLLIVEVKNEVGLGGSCPIIECCEYYRLLMQHLPADLLAISSLPCLQLSIVGPYIQLNMLSILQDTTGRSNVVCCEPAGDLISLVCSPVLNEQLVCRVSTLMASIRTCITHMQRYYSEHQYKTAHFVSEGVDDVTFIAADNFPSVEFLTKQVFQGKLVFEGVTFESESVIIKIVARSYGKNVHEFLHNAGFAPQLKSIHSIGNVRAVIMDNIQDGQTLREWLASSPPPERVEGIKAQCEAVLQLLQAENMVHGDLRSHNILVSNSSDKVYIVDFDWSGIAGEVTYPFTLNTKVGYPAGPGDAILIDHDQYWINRIFSGSDDSTIVRSRRSRMTTEGSLRSELSGSGL